MACQPPPPAPSPSASVAPGKSSGLTAPAARQPQPHPEPFLLHGPKNFLGQPGTSASSPAAPQQLPGTDALSPEVGMRRFLPIDSQPGPTVPGLCHHSPSPPPPPTDAPVPLHSSPCACMPPAAVSSVVEAVSMGQIKRDDRNATLLPSVLFPSMVAPSPALHLVPYHLHISKPDHTSSSYLCL